MTVVLLSTALFSCTVQEPESHDNRRCANLAFATAINNARLQIAKSSILETNFPNGNSSIGMFITRDGVTLPSTSPNMLAVLSRASGVADMWQFSNGADFLVPSAVIGSVIQTVAYYPWNDAAQSNAVGFDLSTFGSRVSQPDLMFAQSTTTVADVPLVQLQFQHAFTLIELSLKKLGAQSIVITQVGFDNANAKQFVCNEGSMNPANGVITPSGFGPVELKQQVTLSETTAQSVFIMVPPFMSADFEDNDIVLNLQFEKDGESASAQFDFRKNYLNQVNGAWGFKQGVMNVYNLVLEAVPAIGITLDSWQEVAVLDEHVGESLLNVHFSAAPNGAVSSSAGSGYNGSVVSSVATPAPGYALGGWYDGNTMITETSPSSSVYVSGDTLNVKLSSAINGTNFSAVFNDFQVAEPGVAAPRIFVQGTGNQAKLMLTQNPTNFGAFFQYGSVLAWSAYNSLMLLWNPSGLTGDWNEQWSGVMPVPPNLTAQNMNAGMGDPCRLVGYTLTQVQNALAQNIVLDNKTWKMPSSYVSSASSSQASVDDVNGYYVAFNDTPPGQSGLFFPAAGFYDATGTLQLQFYAGSYWATLLATSTAGYSMYFYEQITFENITEQTWACSVRCIRQ